MGAYDNRRVMLDPGLTAMALRGLHNRDGHYPFMDRLALRRRSRRRAWLARGSELRLSAQPPSSRWQRAVTWFRTRHRSVVPA